MIIQVKIDNREQVFSDYAYGGDNLNSELSEYLIEKAEHATPLPRKENFTIQIHTNNAHLRLPEITQCIHRHFHDEYDSAKRKMQTYTRIAILLFVLTLTSIVSWYFAEIYLENFFVSEILDLLTWVFGWTFVEMIVFEQTEVVRDCSILRRLAYANVVINSKTKLDTPIYI